MSPPVFIFFIFISKKDATFFLRSRPRVLNFEIKFFFLSTVKNNNCYFDDRDKYLYRHDVIFIWRSNFPHRMSRYVAPAEISHKRETIKLLSVRIPIYHARKTLSLIYRSYYPRPWEKFWYRRRYIARHLVNCIERNRRKKNFIIFANLAKSTDD